MNQERRKKLAELRDRMSDLQSQTSTLIADLQEVLDEEQSYLDNMPESLQDSEKGEKAQAAIDLMDNLISEMTSLPTWTRATWTPQPNKENHMTTTTMTPAQLLASIKNQAQRAVYDERDDTRK